jgi:hypothetical protein
LIINKTTIVAELHKREHDIMMSRREKIILLYVIGIFNGAAARAQLQAPLLVNVDASLQVPYVCIARRKSSVFKRSTRGSHDAPTQGRDEI